MRKYFSSSCCCYYCRWWYDWNSWISIELQKRNESSHPLLSSSLDRWILFSFLIVLMLFSSSCLLSVFHFSTFSLVSLIIERQSFFYEPIKRFVWEGVENNWHWLSLFWRKLNRLEKDFHFISTVFSLRYLWYLKAWKWNFEIKDKESELTTRSIIKPFLWIGT